MNGDPTPQSLEIFKDKFAFHVLDLFECCAAVVVMYRIHDTLAGWLVLLTVAPIYIHLRMKPSSVVIDFQKKLAVYQYPKCWFFKKHHHACHAV